jgi:hypothetical protein
MPFWYPNLLRGTHWIKETRCDGDREDVENKVGNTQRLASDPDVWKLSDENVDHGTESNIVDKAEKK